jgi:hypothetical protein
MRRDWEQYGDEWRRWGREWSHWGHNQRRYWRQGYGPRGGFFFFWPGMILLLFLLFGVFKFLWPLLLIGLFVAIAKRATCSTRHYYGSDPDDLQKRKHDELDGEKAKRTEDDQRRYIQTEDGDWLEII